jgi:hypothetical protein
MPFQVWGGIFYLKDLKTMKWWNSNKILTKIIVQKSKATLSLRHDSCQGIVVFVAHRNTFVVTIQHHDQLSGAV